MTTTPQNKKPLRIKIGDLIVCDGIRGTVSSISYTSTMIDTVDGSVIAFQNSQLFTKNYKNMTRNHGYELHVLDVGVAYGTKVAEAKKYIIAAGAKENYLAFPGSTLPGVMGAGAAQTMININRVLPGKKIVMVGSGNVGLIVSYQLMQAGAEVVSLVEAADKIGGYAVHAGKIRRAGVPILTSTTIKRILGETEVTGVELVDLDSSFAEIPGSERIIDCDTVCLAVGLNPMTELAWMAGCQFEYLAPFGGHVPLHDENMETTVPGVYVAGDVTGVEEASTAMEEGNLAGIAAAEALGYLTPADAAEKKQAVYHRLAVLRSGPFGERRRQLKQKQLAAMETYKKKMGGAAVQ